MSNRNIEIFVILIILLVSFGGYLLIKDKPVFTDEKTHYGQIERFSESNFQLREELTTFPGYHFIGAIFGFLTLNSSLENISLFAILISLFSVFIFIYISKSLDKEKYLLKSLHWVFLPILFPFLFLIYTDVLSTILILLLAFLTFKKNYSLAGLIGMIALTIRQNNIIWYIAFFIFGYIKENSFKFSKHSIVQYLKKSYTFLLGFVVFFLIILYMHGLVPGDKEFHPLKISLGNIFFILFLFFFIFLPYNLSLLPKIKSAILIKKWILPLIILIFIIYIIWFKVDHPYNQLNHGFHLRNLLLSYFSNIYLKILFFIPIAYSLIALSVTKLKYSAQFLVYPTAFLYLIPSWLIEQRYYLIPFSLFILLKEDSNPSVDYATMIYYILSSFILFWGILQYKFFI